MPAPPALFAVFAHPDDETCRAGGSLARYAAQGVVVTVLTATRGERGACGRWLAMPTERFARRRSREFQRATRALGVAGAVGLEYADGALAACPRGPLIAVLADLICHFTPDVLLTWCPGRPGQRDDHAVIGRLATLAALRAARCASPACGAPPHRVRKLYYAPLVEEPCPGLPAYRVASIDVGAYLGAKAAALRAHETQGDCAGAVLQRFGEPAAATERFVRGWPRGRGAETDLFAGLRRRRARGSPPGPVGGRVPLASGAGPGLCCGYDDDINEQEEQPWTGSSG